MSALRDIVRRHLAALTGVISPSQEDGALDCTVGLSWLSTVVRGVYMCDDFSANKAPIEEGCMSQHCSNGKRCRGRSFLWEMCAVGGNDQRPNPSESPGIYTSQGPEVEGDSAVPVFI